VTADRLLPVALVDGAIGSRIAEVNEIPWHVLANRLCDPVRFEGEKVRAPAWLPVRLREGAPLVRKDEHVAAVSCVVFDIDEGARVEDVRHTLRGLGYAAVLHTTWSHSAEHHKARVVFPLAQDCPRDEWLEVWHCAEQWASKWGATIDPKCKNPSRLYFLPALPAHRYQLARVAFRCERVEGPMLRWRWLQAHHRPPRAPRVPPVPPKGPRWTGDPSQDLTRKQRARQRAARKIVEHRARSLVAGGKGGRNQTCYTAARVVAQMAQTGAITRDEGAAILLDAAITAGLSHAEASRAIHNGLSKGETDEAFQWNF